MTLSLEQQLAAALNDTQPLTAVAAVAMMQPLAEPKKAVVYNSRVNLRAAFEGASLADLDRILLVANQMRDLEIAKQSRQEAIHTFTTKLHNCYTSDWYKDFDTFNEFLTFVASK